MSEVIDIHKINGVRPDFDVYIGRRVRFTEFTKDSKWGNKFYENLQRYEDFIRENLWNDLDELKGKKLGCWCITSKEIYPIRCHGQILMKLIREREETKLLVKDIYRFIKEKKLSENK